MSKGADREYIIPELPSVSPGNPSPSTPTHPLPRLIDLATLVYPQSHPQAAPSALTPMATSIFPFFQEFENIPFLPNPPPAVQIGASI